jgi:hypothetical protein
MIDRQHELPLVRQAVLVGLSRGAVYYEPRPIPDSDLMLMRRIDELALGAALCGQPHVARSAQRRRSCGRPAACGDADEANGDRGDLSQDKIPADRIPTIACIHICCAS